MYAHQNPNRFQIENKRVKPHETNLKKTFQFKVTELTKNLPLDLTIYLRDLKTVNNS